MKMIMIEETPSIRTPSHIRLSKTQVRVLGVLRTSPRPLKPVFLFKFLKLDRNLFYYSLWRCLKLLQRNNLIIRVGDSYTITEEGIKEFKRRKKQ